MCSKSKGSIARTQPSARLRARARHDAEAGGIYLVTLVCESNCDGAGGGEVGRGVNREGDSQERARDRKERERERERDRESSAPLPQPP